MNITEKDIELFDGYMDGTLSDTERTQFEERLRSDEAYRKAYELHSEVVLGIQRKELKAMLQEQEVLVDNPNKTTPEDNETNLATASRPGGNKVKLFVSLAAAACFFFGVFIVHDAWKLSSLGGNYIAHLEQPMVRGSGVEESLALIYEDLQEGNYSLAQDNIDEARQCIKDNAISINYLINEDGDNSELIELYREELITYHTHYIFAVDISGSMRRYGGWVTNAMQLFIQSLPDNDRIDVIPFGTEALPNLLNYSGVINSDVRASLSNNIKNIYADPSYPIDIRRSTDIAKAIDAIGGVLQSNQDYKVNMIILLSDFINSNKDNISTDFRLPDYKIEQLNMLLNNATKDAYTRSIALKFPNNYDHPGYCLDQLKEQVFPHNDGYMEIVPITDPDMAIGQWFDQLQQDIMDTKLDAFIDERNEEVEYHQQMLKLDSDELDWYQALLYAKTHKIFKAKRLLKQIARSDSRYLEEAKAMLE